MISKRKPGRPTKLTPEVQEAICKALERGEVHVHAAEHGGISETTYYEWRTRGEEGEQPFAEFLEATTRAEAKGRRLVFEKIRQHAVNDWRAGAWLLERRYPQYYGRAARVDLKVESKVEIDHDLAASAIEKLRAAIAKAEVEQEGAITQPAEG